jgi:hypothetical protein
MLAGDLNATLERYTQYYEHVHGEAVDPRILIPEILHAFLDADREFQSWARSADRNQPRRVPAPASTNDSTKAPA